MKKLATLALALISGAGCMAQDATVKDANKLFNKKNYDEAIQVLTPALTSPETVKKADAYDLLFRINSAIVQQEVDKTKEGQTTDSIRMYSAMVAAAKAAVECDKIESQPNEKGKVKIKYRKEHAPMAQTYRLLSLNSLTFFANKGQDEKMLDAAKFYIESKDCPVICYELQTDGSGDFKKGKDGEPVIVKDEYVAIPAYNVALVSYNKKDYATALKYAAIAKTDERFAASASEIELFCAKENAKTHEDSLAYVNMLKAAHAKNPDDGRYYNMIMQYYSTPGKEKELLVWASDEVQRDPTNKMSWALKGQGEMNNRDWDSAIESFKKAVEIDEEFVPALFNLGACYNSKANEMKDKFADSKGYMSTESLNKIKAVLKQAEPVLEKVKELDPDKKQAPWTYPLYQVYYALYGSKDARVLELENELQSK